MKLSQVESAIGTSAQKMARFLVIKMLDAQATGNYALSDEISRTLHEAGVKLTRLNSGAVSFVVGPPEMPFKGAVFPPAKKPTPPQETPHGG